jgi:uncharacterized RDD family membrane protein YckC
MQTLEPIYLEYRCKSCWNSNIAKLESAGNEEPCRNCGRSNTIPLSTAENIERALEMLASDPALLEKPIDRQPTPVVEEKALGDQAGTPYIEQVPEASLPETNFFYHPNASIALRVFGWILDYGLFFGSLFVSFYLAVWLSSQGLGFENPIQTIRQNGVPSLYVVSLIGLFPLLLVACQWILLATSGQTIAMKLLMMRIVTDGGRVPGFLRAVVLRNCVPNLISIVPIVNAAFFFADGATLCITSRKSLHDYIAGTRVVSLWH